MDGFARYLVDSKRASEKAAWLRCNDIDPATVPFNSEVFIETVPGGDWVIRYAVYARTELGSIKYNQDTGTFEEESRTAPMVNDPPMYWLTNIPVSVVEAADAWLPGFNLD